MLVVYSGHPWKLLVVRTVINEKYSLSLTLSVFTQSNHVNPYDSVLIARVKNSSEFSMKRSMKFYQSL